MLQHFSKYTFFLSHPLPNMLWLPSPGGDEWTATDSGGAAGREQEDQCHAAGDGRQDSECCKSSTLGTDSI